MRRVEVAAEFEVGRPRRVGLLVQDGRDLYFRYDRDWLAEGFNVSPPWGTGLAGLRRAACSVSHAVGDGERPYGKTGAP